MLSEENYNTMKDKYGSVGSWAIWRPAGDTPKSNTHDMSQVLMVIRVRAELFLG